jgi:hypothetical protein
MCNFATLSAPRESGGSGGSATYEDGPKRARVSALLVLRQAQQDQCPARSATRPTGFGAGTARAVPARFPASPTTPRWRAWGVAEGSGRCSGGVQNSPTAAFQGAQGADVPHHGERTRQAPGARLHRCAAGSDGRTEPAGPPGYPGLCEHGGRSPHTPDLSWTTVYTS